MQYKRSLRRYAGGFARRFLEALGVLAVVAGAVAVFVPDLLKDQWWLVAAAGALAVGWAIYSPCGRKTPSNDSPLRTSPSAWSLVTCSHRTRQPWLG